MKTQAAILYCDPEEARKKLEESDAGVYFADVREGMEYETEKIAGVANHPLSRLEEEIQRIPKGKSVYVVCLSGKRSEQAARRLSAEAFTEIKVMRGGLNAWKERGFPVESGRARVWALERQVRFAAGNLVLLGIVLAGLVHPGWIGLSAFVGAGLVFAGVTDTCGMALFLAKMPWNQRHAQ